MKTSNNKKYRICCAFDTETSNIPDERIAFPVCYQVNDLRDTSISEYEHGDIHIYRYEDQFEEYIEDLVEYGMLNNVIPIMCGYNTPFDMISVMEWVHAHYDVKVVARSRNCVYIYDMYLNGEKVLRVWDTFFLEPRGLEAMGEACGLQKDDEWNYDLVRTPSTRLTRKEEYYAKRDVEVIPAYLRWLLDTNEWMTESMLGTKILTATGIVRNMCYTMFYRLECPSTSKRKKTVGKEYRALCQAERPRDYYTYALRRACFRGGLTFTAGNYASTIVRNVASLDVTSMHHTFINGRDIPVSFKKASPDMLNIVANNIVNTSLDDVLSNYNRPFGTAINAHIYFKNVRIKPDSVFDAYGIGLLSESKFAGRPYYEASPMDMNPLNEANNESDNDVKDCGFVDVAHGALFAFGKLMRAKDMSVYLTEIELWCVSQVYTWDEMGVLDGEYSTNSRRPPDYVCLQSNYLYEKKKNTKYLLAKYQPGKPYDGDVSFLPETMAKRVKSGTMTADELDTYYTHNVKASFNGIYGTQSQNEWKPEYMVSDDCVTIDDSTRISQDTFDANRRDEHGHAIQSKVLYTYGMRIAGGSRMHLIIGMMLLYRSLRGRIIITGGDTDSMKVACDDDVTDDDLIKALKPLHDASDTAIRRAQIRLRSNYKEYASDLDGVGHFVIEWCNDAHTSKRYKQHMEAWNKARISLDVDNHVHVTCAGLPQPKKYNVAKWVEHFIKDNPDELFGEYANIALGYNKTYAYGVTHMLNSTNPSYHDKLNDYVKDYRGKASIVSAHQACCLYPIEKVLGDTDTMDNANNLRWLYVHGIHPNTVAMTLDIDTLEVTGETRCRTW